MYNIIMQATLFEVMGGFKLKTDFNTKETGITSKKYLTIHRHLVQR